MHLDKIWIRLCGRGQEDYLKVEEVKVKRVKRKRNDY